MLNTFHKNPNYLKGMMIWFLATLREFLDVENIIEIEPKHSPGSLFEIYLYSNDTTNTVLLILGRSGNGYEISILLFEGLFAQPESWFPFWEITTNSCCS